MNIVFTAHAQQRLVEHGIKHDYVDYALRMGTRVNKSRDYHGVPAQKTHCQGLVVIHTYGSIDSLTVLTTYWHDQPNPHTFDRLIHKRQCKQLWHCTTKRRQMEKRKRRQNNTWDFWNDVECVT